MTTAAAAHFHEGDEGRLLGGEPGFSHGNPVEFRLGNDALFIPAVVVGTEEPQYQRALVAGQVRFRTACGGEDLFSFDGSGRDGYIVMPPTASTAAYTITGPPHACGGGSLDFVGGTSSYRAASFVRPVGASIARIMVNYPT